MTPRSRSSRPITGGAPVRHTPSAAALRRILAMPRPALLRARLLPAGARPSRPEPIRGAHGRATRLASSFHVRLRAVRTVSSFLDRRSAGRQIEGAGGRFRCTDARCTSRPRPRRTSHAQGGPEVIAEEGGGEGLILHRRTRRSRVRPDRGVGVQGAPGRLQPDRDAQGDGAGRGADGRPPPETEEFDPIGVMAPRAFTSDAMA